MVLQNVHLIKMMSVIEIKLKLSQTKQLTEVVDEKIDKICEGAYGSK